PTARNRHRPDRRAIGRWSHRMRPMLDPIHVREHIEVDDSCKRVLEFQYLRFSHTVCAGQVPSHACNAQSRLLTWPYSFRCFQSSGVNNMTAKDVIRGLFATNDFVLNEYLKDIVDADLLIRPVPNANHAAWQLGHLIKSEAQLLKLIPGVPLPELPAG